MSFEASMVVAFFIVFTAVVAVAWRQGRAREQAREEELKRSASARGWTFHAVRDRGYRIYKFSGTTE